MAKKILIIDDEPELVKAVKIRLEANGYEVIAAFDGIQGIQTARSEKPDLIILDIMMPGMDGFRVCDNLKMSSHTWAIPIIFLTAKDTPEDEKKGYGVGAVCYVKKPYEPNELLEIVKRALEPSREPIEEDKKWRKRILLIENQPDLIETLKQKLSEVGYDVKIALSLQEAFLKAKLEVLNVIVLDGIMSRLDSHETFFAFKKEVSLKEIPIIITAPEPELAYLITELKSPIGTTYFLKKPFEVKDLIGHIVSAIDLEKSKE